MFTAEAAEAWEHREVTEPSGGVHLADSDSLQIHTQQLALSNMGAGPTSAREHLLWRKPQQHSLSAPEHLP